MPETPPKSVKFQEKDGCFLCGREEANSRKRRSLAQNELLEKVCQLLPVTSDLLKINSHRYVCETPCYRDLEKFFKLKANIENDLKEHNNVRNAACLPMLLLTNRPTRRDSLEQVYLTDVLLVV